MQACAEASVCSVWSEHEPGFADADRGAPHLWTGMQFEEAVEMSTPIHFELVESCCAGSTDSFARSPGLPCGHLLTTGNRATGRHNLPNILCAAGTHTLTLVNSPFRQKCTCSGTSLDACQRTPKTPEPKSSIAMLQIVPSCSAKGCTCAPSGMQGVRTCAPEGAQRPPATKREDAWPL